MHKIAYSPKNRLLIRPKIDCLFAQKCLMQQAGLASPFWQAAMTALCHARASQHISEHIIP